MNFSFSELIFDQLIFGQLVWSSYPLKYMSEGGLAEVLGNKPEPGSLGTREVMSSLGSKIIIRVTYAPARLLLSQPPCLLSFLSLFISPFYPISLKQNPGSAECIIISTLHVGQDILSKAFAALFLSQSWMIQGFRSCYTGLGRDSIIIQVLIFGKHGAVGLNSPTDTSS